MSMVRRNLIPAVVGLFFILGISIIFFADAERRKTEQRVYSEGRYERLLVWDEESCAQRTD